MNPTYLDMHYPAFMPFLQCKPKSKIDSHILTKLGTELKQINDPRTKKDYILYFISSLSKWIQESGFKLLSHCYRVPKNLNRIYPSLSPVCWRCKVDVGLPLHICWEYPKLLEYRRGIGEIMQELTGTEIADDLARTLLHLNRLSQAHYIWSLSIYLLNTARAHIPAWWKSKDPPALAS